MYQYGWTSYERWWQKRFWTRVDRSGGAEACWPWTGHLSPRGYGVVRYNGKMPRAHRLAYHFRVGPLPDVRVLQLDHRCRVRHCCNPSHLELVTARENLLRGATLAAANAAKTHCMHGHLLSEENVYREANGARRCRTCQRATWARQDAKRRGHRRRRSLH
jgi:hypothetical protein